MSKQTDLINVTDAITVSGSNVGIGSVPSSIQSNFDTLQIGGNLTLNVDSTGVGAGVYMGNNVYRDSTNSRWEYIYTDEASQYLQASGTHVWRTAASGSANAAITWSEAMRIDSTGRLNLQSSAGTSSILYHGNSLTATSPTTNLSFGTRQNGGIFLFTNNSEAMRIDSSGNVLVGKTSGSFGTAGIALMATDQLRVTRSSGDCGSFNRLSTDGIILDFYGPSGLAGSIGSKTGDIYIGNGQNVGLMFEQTGSDRIEPCFGTTGALRDNAIGLGGASSRFNVVYAATGSINTSDRNEKQDIDVMSEAETRVAVACKGLIRKFRWIDAVAKKGDDARIHFGIIAQELQDAFAAEGLDASRYAMFCSDTWWETQTDVPAVEAVDEVLDEDGNVVTEAVEAKEAYTRTDTYETLEEAPEGATERTRLGVRYPELLAFIIGAM